MTKEARCPFHSAGARTTQGAPSNTHWWAEQLNLSILHQHTPASSPLGLAFDCAAAWVKVMELGR